MTTKIIHISVCICTFKRPDLLERLLTKLEQQETDGVFSYSVVVTDNDIMESARRVVEEFDASSFIPSSYSVEPEQNIAKARNRALENARGDFIAFIDDDEMPENTWLRNLLATCNSLGVDGVLGPVLPYFQHVPPCWVIKGKFFERPVYSTGYILNWYQSRTGNVIFRREILKGLDPVFSPEFSSGSEDVDFFKRMMQRGYVFAWCNEAIVHELVPPLRCSSGYLLRRALLRGSNYPKREAKAISALSRSFIAIPLYALALPLLALCGKHVLIKYLIKLCDHGSRLFAYLGLQLVRDREM